jgi:hypothetical protein
MLSNLNKSPTHSDGDRLRLISRAEFLHNVFDVSFHGFFRDEKLFGNSRLRFPPAI